MLRITYLVPNFRIWYTPIQCYLSLPNLHALLRTLQPLLIIFLRMMWPAWEHWMVFFIQTYLITFPYSRSIIKVASHCPEIEYEYGCLNFGQRLSDLGQLLRPVRAQGRSHNGSWTTQELNKNNTWIHHKNEPSHGVPAIFWHAKDFGTAHKFAAEPWGTYDDIGWL